MFASESAAGTARAECSGMFRCAARVTPTSGAARRVWMDPPSPERPPSESINYAGGRVLRLSLCAPRLEPVPGRTRPVSEVCIAGLPAKRDTPYRRCRGFLRHGMPLSIIIEYGVMCFCGIFCIRLSNHTVFHCITRRSPLCSIDHR